jgi:hypothetical protein
MASVLNYSDPVHLLSLAHFHEVRGALSDACRITHDGVESLSNANSDNLSTVFSKIFKLSAAYFRCYAQGQWTEAITIAVGTLNNFAIGQAENPLLEPVSLYKYYNMTLTYILQVYAARS